MINFWLFYDILFFIIATITTANIELKTQKGIIYGRQTQQTMEYLGIQYAKAIRWKPPIDLASEIFLNGSFDATSFGPCCPQPSPSTLIQDEECLYLNIFKPIVPSNHSLLPVFVWIHGGSHNHGCSSVYNASKMINQSPPDQPVIVITINYRLGILADMYLKELIEEDPQWPTAGNYMYLDMLSALRWIQKNIRDYGGDPNTVSLFGQSAGGLSVIDLGAVKGSANLYRTGLSQSGLTSPGSYSAYYNMSNALNYSTSLVQRLNCSNDDKEKVLSCMRNTSFEDLLKVYIRRYTRPIIDNYFFPLYPPLAIQSGTYNNVSLIMGNNDYELPICLQYPDMNFTEAVAIVASIVGQKWTPSVVDYYHLNNCLSDRNATNNRCCDIIRLIELDNIFDCDIRRLFDAFYLKYGPEYETNKLFSYHLNCHPKCPTGPSEGLCQHSSEVEYVFAFGSDLDPQHLQNCTWDNQTRAFSNGIIAHWINIATTGRPLSDWPSYDPSMPKHFHITPDQGFLPQIWNTNCSFFDQLQAKELQNDLEIITY